MDPVEVNEEIYRELEGYANTIDEPMYSKVSYGASGNAAKTQFFPGGSTLTDTNLVKARELPQGHLKIVEAISVSVAPDVTPADLKEIMKEAILEFAPNSTAYKRHYPLDLLGAGGGASGYFLQAIAADDNLVTHGSPNKLSVYRLRKPEVLRGGIPFECNIQHPAAITPAAATKVEVRLLGPYAYPAREAVQ